MLMAQGGRRPPIPAAQGGRRPLPALLLLAVLAAFGCQHGASTTEAKEPAAPPTESLTPGDTMTSEEHASTFVLVVDGQFTAQAPWDVNLINAPVTAWDNEPDDLAIDKAALEALNSQAQATVLSTFQRLGLRVDDGADQASPDVFSVHLQLAPGNRMGGRHGGLSFEISITRPDTPEPVVAIGRLEADSDDLVAAFARALGEALPPLVESLSLPLTQVETVPIELRLVLEGLDDDARAYASGPLLDCLGRELGAVPRDERPPLILDVALRENSPAELLAELPAQLAFLAGTHGKSACSVWRSPLDGRKTHAEVVDGVIVLSWPASN